MATNLCKLMKEKGLTAYRVAKDTDIGQSTIRAYMDGKREIGRQNLDKLTEYFGCSAEYMMDKVLDRESAPAGETDKSAAMVMELYRELTPSEKLDFVAKLVETVRNHKAD